MSSQDYQNVLGQAYFFRAYLYYRMVKVLGGVPIITTVQDPTANSATLMVKRNTTLECFNFISLQLDSAIRLLPTTWGANDIGRITKGAAMAVKGEVLLLKASPLFCSTPNAGYWSDANNALLAAKNELDADGYGLYSDNTTKTTGNMWYDKVGAAKEMVLSVRFHYPEKTNGQSSIRPNLEGGVGSCEPTWEMVKDYPMANGLDTRDPNSGYDSTIFWKNRDPRFYTDIVYNGARFDFQDITPHAEWIFPGIGSLDGFHALSSFNTTGFYCRKGVDTTLGKALANNTAMDWPIVRYAEVLLNLAEAANEIGNPAVARGLIIQIRQRAHITAGATGSYGLGTAVGSDYRATLNAIMKEREIEFAFEGKRFWDLRRRRWFNVLNNYRTLHAMGPYFNSQMASTKYGIDITKSNSDIAAQLTSVIANSPTSFDRDIFLKDITNYQYVPIVTNSNNQINVPDNYYFGAINPQDILQNSNLLQTIGWDSGKFNPMIQ